MGAKTSIEWTDGTWNPLRGCQQISPGCDNCYAMRIAARFSGAGQAFEGLAEMTPNGPRWTGKIAAVEKHILDPIRWRKPRRVFVDSVSDLFHKDVASELIDRVFAVMMASPQHTFQVLTKRPLNMLAYLARAEDRVRDAAQQLAADQGWCHANEYDAKWPLPNVWIGTSVEDFPRKNRIDALRKAPAALRFLSLEPLLDDLGTLDLDGIGWVIAGCESGPGFRPMDVAWVRSIRDQCARQRVPFFFKQAMSGFQDDRGKWKHAKVSTPLLDGRRWAEFPEVRQ